MFSETNTLEPVAETLKILDQILILKRCLTMLTKTIFANKYQLLFNRFLMGLKREKGPSITFPFSAILVLALEGLKVAWSHVNNLGLENFSEIGL